MGSLVMVRAWVKGTFIAFRDIFDQSFDLRETRASFIALFTRRAQLRGRFTLQSVAFQKKRAWADIAQSISEISTENSTVIQYTAFFRA